MKPFPSLLWPSRTLLVMLLPMLALAGCSVSYSLEKSSDSISAGFESISTSFDSFTGSSGSGGEGAALLERFFDDVGAVVRNWVLEPAGPDEFERMLGELALDYGITSWEQEPALFFAIGSGLRQAGVADTALVNQPILQSTVMQRHREIILSGYDSS